METLTVDLRMLYSSGIGVYLKNLIPLVIAKCPSYQFNLLGDAAKLRNLNWTQSAQTRLIDCNPPIYSIVEQWSIPKNTPRDTTLFWSPHYNIPLNHKGALLVTIHDVLHVARPNFVPGWHQRAYARFMFDRVSKQADAVSCDSEFTRQEFMAHTGHVNNNLTVNHLGVDTAWFNGAKNNVSPHARPYIIFVGNVKPHKNLIGLLRAFEMIQNQIPHDLIIVGKATGFRTGDAQVLEKARTLERVKITGEIDDALLQQYVEHAELLVLPSLYEGFGLTALEGMAQGCPVLAASIPALEELCGDAALYCDPLAHRDIADKIMLLVNDAALRNRFIAKGTVRAKQFTWDQCATRSVQIIERLLA